MVDFTDVLNTQADLIERPKPLPIGSYICIVAGLPEYTVRSTKNGDSQTITYKLKPIAAKEDVDESSLHEFGGIAAAPTFTHTIWLGGTAEEQTRNLFRLKDFVGHCGQAISGVSAKTMAESVVNTQVGIAVTHRPAPDGSAIYAEVKRTFAV